MPITEVALLRISSGTTSDDATLRSNLLQAKNVMQDFTGHTFYYMQQLEDPACIYVLGEWDSLSQHMNDFIPSATNQSLLETLKDKLSVSWLLHLDTPHASLPLPTTPSQLSQAHLGEQDGGLIWSIGRHFIKPASKTSFTTSFETNKHFLSDYVTEGFIAGGWRLDKESSSQEEFVLFCPWKSREQHADFAHTKGFQEYAKIGESIEGVEVRHMRLLDI